MIELKNICLSYDRSPVLKDINISLKDRGLTSIIGPNGAGKSSLLSVASAQVDASEGSITFDGQPLASIPREVLSTQLAYLRQDNQIGARISVLDLICFGRFPYHRGRPSTYDCKKINDTVEYFQLGEIQHRYLDQLSGGQRQRAFIAMVWAQDTQYIFLDEPLNNLDMKHSASIMKYLKQASYDFKKSIVVVLHDINFASHYSDEIIAMRNGQIYQSGTSNTIMNSECLSPLYDMPIQMANVENTPVCLYFK
jgi:iron complex transport system ATP-binding protein